MALFLISRVFVLAENDFNQIKENFLDSQRETNASGSPDQVITCTCPFTSLGRFSILNQEPVFIFKKGQLNPSFCKFMTCFHSCYWRYCWILKFLIFTLLRILRITVCKFPKWMILTILYWFLVDLWTRLCFIKQGIICHNISGLSDCSSQWMVALTV